MPISGGDPSGDHLESIDEHYSDNEASDYDEDGAEIE